jgi:hypothetical protein
MSTETEQPKTKRPEMKRVNQADTSGQIAFYEGQIHLFNTGRGGSMTQDAVNAMEECIEFEKKKALAKEGKHLFNL